MLPLPRWFTVGPRSPRSSVRRPFRPCAEALDERALPSVSALTGAGTLQAVIGSPFSGVLATFAAADVSGGNNGAALPHLHATIDWGDGHTTAGTVGGPDALGNLSVSGTNVFAAALTYPVTVQVTDDRDQASAYTLDLVSVYSGLPIDGQALPPGFGTGVTSNSLSVTAVPVNAPAGQVFTGIVGVIQDTTPGATGSNLAAVIDWGDGSRIDVVPVQPTATPGVFDIVASHFYGFGGTGTTQVWVQDLSDGRTAVAAGSVTVSDVAPSQPAPAPSGTTASAPSQPQASGSSGPQRLPDDGSILPGGWAKLFSRWAFTRHGHHRFWRPYLVMREWFAFPGR